MLRSASDGGGLTKDHTFLPYALPALSARWGAAASPEALQSKEITAVIPRFAQQFTSSRAMLHTVSHRIPQTESDQGFLDITDDHPKLSEAQ